MAVGVGKEVAVGKGVDVGIGVTVGPNCGSTAGSVSATPVVPAAPAVPAGFCPPLDGITAAVVPVVPPTAAVVLGAPLAGTTGRMGAPATTRWGMSADA